MFAVIINDCVMVHAGNVQLKNTPSAVELENVPRAREEISTKAR